MAIFVFNWTNLWEVLFFRPTVQTSSLFYREIILLTSYIRHTSASGKITGFIHVLFVFGTLCIKFQFE